MASADLARPPLARVVSCPPPPLSTPPHTNTGTLAHSRAGLGLCSFLKSHLGVPTPEEFEALKAEKSALEEELAAVKAEVAELKAKAAEAEAAASGAAEGAAEGAPEGAPEGEAEAPAEA